MYKEGFRGEYFQPVAFMSYVLALSLSWLPLAIHPPPPPSRRLAGRLWDLQGVINRRWMIGSSVRWCEGVCVLAAAGVWGSSQGIPNIPVIPLQLQAKWAFSGPYASPPGFVSSPTGQQRREAPPRGDKKKKPSLAAFPFNPVRFVWLDSFSCMSRIKSRSFTPRWRTDTSASKV